MELELIERLKKKQVEQQQALQELQEAMSLTIRCSKSVFVDYIYYLIFYSISIIFQKWPRIACLYARCSCCHSVYYATAHAIWCTNF